MYIISTISPLVLPIMFIPFVVEQKAAPASQAT